MTNGISIVGDELQHEIGIRSNRRRRPIMIAYLNRRRRPVMIAYVIAAATLRTYSSWAFFRVAIHCPKRDDDDIPLIAHLADLSSDLHRAHIDHLHTPFKRQFPFCAF
ncbi:hypothetical protein M422DRAFT_267787 [Sphaerobolus stellatus SS14]|uniref:Uncharacterized protein n=1 Tax=Sphaerobolus stellatus (strain SS14) TaxID=990650 RepID=A0A0C9UP09_SPHS4|nr:hypothetical protein M422DRAFT_267787 [Sphaerobolus stellatus SS14]